VSAKVVGEPRPVTTGTRSWSTPDLSPDGQSVAFYTLDQPEGDIYIARADGSGLRQVTSDTAIDRMPRWSPDGRWISFFSNRAGALNVWRIGADGSDLQRLTTVPSGYHAWSPDGRRMAAVIGMLTLRDSVIIIDFDSSPKPRIEPIPRSNIGPFILNAWSPDGERLVGQIGAVGGVGRGVAVYSFRTRSYEKLSDFGEWPVWLPDSRRILFVADQHSFWVVDSRTKETRKISSVDRDVIGPARLTADGRMMTFSRRVTEADVWLMTLK
jgi:tricorn protease-like protein